MNKHTPGPWNIANKFNAGRGSFDIIKPHSSVPEATVGYVIANVSYAWHQDDGTPTEETAANARLIAAAPDLLAALESLLLWDNGGDIRPGELPGDLIDDARAAIRRARGD